MPGTQVRAFKPLSGLCLPLSSTDRTGERFFHLNAWWWGVILGYIIGTTTMSVGGRYVAMFLMASGYAGALPSTFHDK